MYRQPGCFAALTLPALVACIVVIFREWGDERSLAYLATLAMVLLLGGSMVITGVLLTPIALLIGKFSPTATPDQAMRRKASIQTVFDLINLGELIFVAYLVYRSFS